MTFERGVAIRAAVIVVAGVIVYSNSLAAPFIFDDRTAILDNQQIRQLWPLSVPLSPPNNTPVAGRPIVNLSFALSYAIGGLDPRAYRLTNLAIHLLAALTLFGLVRRTLLLPSLRTRFGGHATTLAWSAALIWALHPLPSETIDYVTQRTESMMGLFYLLTMYCSVRALDRQPARWHAAAILACAAGMACKESMLTAPVIVGLYDYVFVASPALRKIRRARLYIGLAMTWLVLAALMWPGPRETVGLNTDVGPWTYLLNQAPMLLIYLREAFWPRNLVLDYGVPQPVTLLDVWLPLLAVVAIALLVLFLLARRPHVGFLGAWCFITLSPTSSFVPIATEVGAERRMYLPLAGLVVLVVLCAYRAWTSRASSQNHNIGVAATVLVCLALAAGTIQRNSEYQTKVSIMKVTVERRPHPRSYQMLANAYFESGQRDEAMRYLRLAKADPTSSFMLGIELISGGEVAPGIEELERFVTLAPSHIRAADAHATLGSVYLSRGQLDQAAAHLREALRREPLRGSAHASMGRVLVQQGRIAEGIGELQTSVDLQPGDLETLRLLGIMQGRSGQLDAAVKTFRRAIELYPKSSRDHYLLGRALAAMGQIAAAVPYFAQAVVLDPQNAEAREDLRRAERDATAAAEVRR
ncbi:MAG TPA: tetratricopeptide repeat protein [Vicinamibacterales bacterium]